MKMSTFANEILNKEMLIEMITLRSDCHVCPFIDACRASADEFPDETCEQFLNRYIEDDRNEG